jgi:RimJ/RimL family protein N-acetyltransferase
VLTETSMAKDGRDLVIREAAGGDAKTILAYLEQVSADTGFLTFGPGEFELSTAEETAYLEGCREAENCLYLLACVDGNLAGTLSFSSGSRPRVRHTGELAVSVLRSYWGLGVASALIDSLLHWARETGFITKINLRVRTDNERAITLYERKGFRVEGTVRKELYIGGVYYDNLLMGLEIS